MMTPEGGGGAAGHAAHGGPTGRSALRQGPPPVPPAFAAKVRLLREHSRRIGEALDRNDLARVRKAFAAFGEAVKAIDSSVLSGHARMMWADLAMLLGNDAVEGADAKTLEDARETYRLVQEHLERLERDFAL